MTREVAAVAVEDARSCVEDKLFELVCICNVKTLVVAKNGAVVLPHKWAGKTLEEAKAECGICLEVTDGRTQYLLIFFVLKMGLKNLAEIVASACGGRISVAPPDFYSEKQSVT